MRDVIAYRQIQELSGVGEEWLVDRELNLVAVFFDGNLKQDRCLSVSDDEKTEVL